MAKSDCQLRLVCWSAWNISASAGRIFHEIWCLTIFRKSVEKIQVSCFSFADPTRSPLWKRQDVNLLKIHRYFRIQFLEARYKIWCYSWRRDDKDACWKECRVLLIFINDVDTCIIITGMSEILSEVLKWIKRASLITVSLFFWGGGGWRRYSYLGI
jgi:hypothetical protein